MKPRIHNSVAGSSSGEKDLTKWRDSFAFSPADQREKIMELPPSRPAASNCPPDSCIWFSSLALNSKNGNGRKPFPFFGPSGETRTRGILLPKSYWNFFLTFSDPFWYLLFQKRYSLELSSPLFSYTPKLNMVNNVVKSRFLNGIGTCIHITFWNCRF